MMTLAGLIVGIGCWDLQSLMYWVGLGVFIDGLFIYGMDN